MNLRELKIALAKLPAELEEVPMMMISESGEADPVGGVSVSVTRKLVYLRAEGIGVNQS